MKTYSFIKLILGGLLVISVGFLSHDLIAQSKQDKAPIKNGLSVDKGIDINVTVSNDTSEDDLNEIKKMLADNGIESDFTNIKRNDLGELIGIEIKLSSNNQSVMSSMSSSLGVKEISFGRKDGRLYISQNGIGNNNFSLYNFPGNNAFSFDNDSLIAQHFKQFGSTNLADMFGDEDSQFMFGSNAISIQELMEKMQNNFANASGGQGKYRFIDDPNTNKLIVIDGEISDFETLNSLAEEDKLTTVDYLKSATAKSIYGNKAKDGAIIATTKE